MNITLYQATQLARIENFVDHETGEIDTVALENAEIALVEKQRAVIAYIKNVGATATMIDNAIADLTLKKKAHEARANSLKSYLAHNMKAAGVTEISAADGTFKAKLYIDRDASTVIDVGAVFPAEFMNPAPPPPSPTPNKTAIKKAIEAGQVLEGARIVKTDRLEIK